MAWFPQFWRVEGYRPVSRLPSNAAGQDYVVGDLHGGYSELMRTLEAFSFEPSTDRLFSVGDLVDRGAEVLACLRLIREPWFYPVMGNHEIMMQEYVLHGNKDRWMANGGEWYLALSANEQEEVRELAHETSRLPCIISVGEVDRVFRVVHAELNATVDSLSLYEYIPEFAERADAIVFARSNARRYVQLLSENDLDAMTAELLSVAEVAALANYSPVTPDVPLTFCGHTRVPRPGLMRSHFLIDTGSGYPDDGARLTVYPVEQAFRYFEQVALITRSVR